MARLYKASVLLLLVTVSFVTGTVSRVKRDEESISPVEPPAPSEPPAEPPAAPAPETPAEPPAEPPPAEAPAQTPAESNPDTQPLEPTPDTTGTMEAESNGPPKVLCTTDKAWIDKAIVKHNAYRALHGADPLVFNDNLCQVAQAYANKLAETHKVMHNPAIQSALLGENLYFNTNTFPMPIDADVAVKVWYDEIHDYNFKTGFPFNETKEILHFTQLVWKGTTDVGIALAKGKRPDGKHANYVVANYSPRGNFDDFLTNVLPASGDAASAGDAKVDDDKPKENAGANGDAPAPPVAASTAVGKYLAIGAILIAVIAGLVSILLIGDLDSLGL